MGRWGDAILHLGSRRAESATRAQALAGRETGNGLSRHPDLPRVWVSNHIQYLTTEEVWAYLLQRPNPWGSDNRALYKLDANTGGGSECPIGAVPIMAKRRPTLPPDLAEALELIKKGQLFALQDWIKSADRLRVTEDPELGEHLLLAAAQTGLHSVVAELLKASEWSPTALASALQIAFEKHRHDLAQLLLDHGAPIARVNFSTICATLFFDHMELFLRQGGNPSHENQFEDALQNYALRPPLRFFLTFRAEFPALEDQAALALYRAVENGHPGKTAG